MYTNIYSPKLFTKSVLFIFILSGMFSCASSANNINIKSNDINNTEDSVVIGRIKLNKSLYWNAPMSKPAFSLVNVTTNETETFYIFGEYSFKKSWEGKKEGYSKPIFQKASAGEYKLYLHGKNKNTLLSDFTVPKGRLVYFGTISMKWETSFVGASEVKSYSTVDIFSDIIVINELTNVINLFKKEYPKVYEMYKNKILSVPK